MADESLDIFKYEKNGIKKLMIKNGLKLFIVLLLYFLNYRHILKRTLENNLKKVLELI